MCSESWKWVHLLGASEEKQKAEINWSHARGKGTLRQLSLVEEGGGHGGFSRYAHGGEGSGDQSEGAEE